MPPKDVVENVGSAIDKGTDIRWVAFFLAALCFMLGGILGFMVKNQHEIQYELIDATKMHRDNLIKKDASRETTEDRLSDMESDIEDIKKSVNGLYFFLRKDGEGGERGDGAVIEPHHDERMDAGERYTSERYTGTDWD